MDAIMKPWSFISANSAENGGSIKFCNKKDLLITSPQWCHHERNRLLDHGVNELIKRKHTKARCAFSSTWFSITSPEKVVLHRASSKCMVVLLAKLLCKSYARPIRGVWTTFITPAYLRPKYVYTSAIVIKVVSRIQIFGLFHYFTDHVWSISPTMHSLDIREEKWLQI